MPTFMRMLIPLIRWTFWVCWAEGKSIRMALEIIQIKRGPGCQVPIRSGDYILGWKPCGPPCDEQEPPEPPVPPVPESPHPPESDPDDPVIPLNEYIGPHPGSPFPMASPEACVQEKMRLALRDASASGLMLLGIGTGLSAVGVSASTVITFDVGMGLLDGVFFANAVAIANRQCFR